MTKPFLTRPGEQEDMDDFVIRVMTNLLGPDHEAVTSTIERMAARRAAAAAAADATGASAAAGDAAAEPPASSASNVADANGE